VYIAGVKETGYPFKHKAQFPAQELSYTPFPERELRYLYLWSSMRGVR
jgi:hypothetical protein